jgi:glycosyltransferase involved in cell wall biosynthesis
MAAIDDTRIHAGLNMLAYSPLYPPDTGGAPVYFSEFADELSNGNAVSVLTSYHPEKPLITAENGVRVYRLVPRSRWLPRVLRAPLEIPVAFLSCLLLVLSGRVGVIHAHPTSLAAVGVALAAELLQLPIGYDCRDEAFPLWLVRLGDVQWWFSCANNIDARLEDDGIPSSSIVRLPVINPPYVQEYARDGGEQRNHEAFEIIYVGAIRESKGVALLIDAFAQFSAARADVRLTIVGDGPFRQTVEQTIADHGVTDRVTVLGSLPHRDALERTAAADVLVLPSASEGTPRVVIEAQELGVPLVATPVGDVPAFVTDDETGVLIERSTDSIVDALERLYGDNDFRLALGSQGQRQMTDRNWQTLAARVEQAYERGW